MIPAPPDRFFQGREQHAEQTVQEVGASAVVDPPRQGQVNLGRALAYGLGVTIAAGVVLGVILLFVISWLVALVVGIAIAWGVRKGAGRTTPGIMVLAACLTLLSVFIGDLVAFSLVGARYGYSFADIFVHYFDLVAVTPGETALLYVCGIVGAIAGAYYIWKAEKDQRLAVLRSRPYAVPAPPPGVLPPSVPAPPQAVSVRVLERSVTRAAAQILFPPPEPHVLYAEYETMMGRATAVLDNRPMVAFRVWGSSKTVDIPVGTSPPKRVTIRFRGMMSPHIDFTLDGRPLSTV